jgi:hypothetical protein
MKPDRNLKAAPTEPRLAPLYMAGEVRRWHANPVLAREAQTNASHQGRCVQLLLMLNPGASPALIRATAFHDVGEVVGDLPGPVKRAHPAMAAAHAMIEAAARDRLCGALPWLTETEELWLDLVDRLEAAAFCITRAPHEALRPGSGWPAVIDRLSEEAAALGVRDRVAEMIEDLFGGTW